MTFLPTKRTFAVACAVTSLATVPLWVRAQSSREINAETDAINAQDDRKLNAAYEALIKDIRAYHERDRAEFLIGSLRESQRAWLKYREAQLAFVGTYQEIGSASARNAGLARYNHELTEARINDFQVVPNPF